MKKLFILLIGICLLISLSSALSNVTPVNVGSTFIQWVWDGSATNVSIDGLIVCDADLSNNTFVLSGLFPNETHTIILHNGFIENESNTTTTLPKETTSADLVWDFFYKYIALITGAVLIIASAVTKNNTPAFIAGFMAFLGLIIVGNDLIGQVMYILLIICAWYVTFQE